MNFSTLEITLIVVIMVLAVCNFFLTAKSESLHEELQETWINNSKLAGLLKANLDGAFKGYEAEFKILCSEILASMIQEHGVRPAKIARVMEYDDDEV